MTGLGPIADIEWRAPDGTRLTCREKLAVLAENLTELQDMARDAFEDALVMGVEEGQMRRILAQMMQELENPYEKN